MPIITVLLLVVRLLLGQANQAGQEKRAGSQDASGALLLWIVLLPIALALAMVVLGGGWAFAPLLFGVLVAMFPWSAARYLAVPLGLPRVAAYVARLPSVTFAHDGAGASALAAAWALLRARSADDASRDWVAARVSALSPTRGAGLAAAGVLAASRGDLEGARCLMRGVRDLSPAACPTIARHAASSFLAADAAARGAWSEVAELGASLRADGPEAWLLSGVGKALLLEPDAPRGWGLWWRWMLAPHRRATMPLVQRALAALDGEFIPADEAFAAPIDVREAGPFDRAMALHASLLAREGGAVGAAELRASAQAWDEVLDDASLARQLEARAAALGTGGAAAAIGQLRATVDDDLAALALAADVPLADLATAGATAARVRAALRDRLLRDVEVASDALRRRVDERRALPGADEWREWSSLAAIHARGVRLAGPELRQLAFHKVHPDATHFAVWLFNDRKERALANAVFRFLLAEAVAVDDATAAGLQQKNIDCGV